MQRHKALLSNSFYAVLLQIVTIVVGFITPKIMLEIYGSEINGLVSSLTQFISYFYLVEAGLSSVTVYSLYSPLFKRNHTEINQVVSASKKFYYQAGGLFSLLILCLSIIYPIFVKTNFLNNIEVGVLVLVLGLSGTIEFFALAKYRTLLTADEKSYILSITSIINVIINCFVVVIFAKLHINIILLKCLSIVGILARSVMLYFYVKKKYSYINFNSDIKNINIPGRWDAMLLQVSGTVHSSSTAVLATIFCTLKEISVYSIYNMVISGINSLIGGVVNAIMPSFGKLVATKNINLIQNTFQNYQTLYYSALAIVYSVLFTTIVPFIQIYTDGIDDANYYVPNLAFLMVLDSLLSAIRSPQGMIIMAAGKFKETKYRAISEALISVSLGVILGSKIGLSGIILGSIVANLYRNIDTVIFVDKYIININKSKTIFKQICVVTIIALLVTLSKLFYVNLDNYFSWLIFATILGFIASLIVLILLAVLQKNIFNLLKKKH